MKCTNDWHIYGYTQYIALHGPAYPRSCPECHSIGDPVDVELPAEKSPKLTLFGMEIKSMSYEQWHIKHAKCRLFKVFGSDPGHKKDIAVTCHGVRCANHNEVFILGITNDCA